MPFPSKIIAGDTTTFALPESEYAHADSWAMKVQLSNATSELTLPGSYLAGEYTFVILVAQSAALKVGDYRFTQYVEKGVDATLERHTLDSANVSVVAGLVSDLAGSRGLASKILEKIEAVLEGRASTDVLKYEIRGRSLERMPIEDLIKWRSYWQKELKKEEAMASGQSIGPRRYRMTLR